MTNLKIFTDNVEDSALQQIKTLASQKCFEDCKIRIMPDVHAGAGCVIGFTADLKDKVVPNIVGVDIGCGVKVVKLKNKNIDLEKLDNVIKEKVPSGFNIHSCTTIKFNKVKEMYCYRNLDNTKRINRSIGTLGGGNHFIEIDKDSCENYYLIIHTGSRNLGKQVASIYQNLAVDLHKGKGELFKQKECLIEQYKKENRKSEIQTALKKLTKEFVEEELVIPKELCYLTGEHKDRYLHDMHICQDYASLNRDIISNIIISSMDFEIDYEFETVHNYLNFKDNIIRKGAISAYKDEKLLIPLNMRDGCILGTGKGNSDWNYSAPHGAGRLMSRKEAFSKLSLNDFKKSMCDIYSTTVNETTLDEAPMAYKNKEYILKNINNTVDIIDILKPIYNYKH